MSNPSPDPFPWHLGVYDAHCHPTDTMSRIDTIPHMKTRALTVMATRVQDQDLVLSAAAKHGVKSSDPAAWSRDECIVPCFGWHPWFAHQLYFDSDSDSTGQDAAASDPPTALTGAAKVSHYQTALAPARPSPSDEDISTFSSLPDPMPISTLLDQTRSHLLSHPYALVGEIGLDRSFRIPFAWDSSAWSKRDSSLTPGGREGRRLTPFRCAPAHQKRVFKAQLALAAELGRAVSVHGVQAHGLVYEALAETWAGCEKVVLSKRERKRRGADHPSVEAQTADESELSSAQSTHDSRPDEKQKHNPAPYPPRVCLHSYSGNPANFKLYTNPAIPVRIFASFSTAINLGDMVDGETPAAFVDMVRAVPDDMVLVESDLHTAGDEMDRRLEDIVRRICEIKGWELEEGVRILGRNWKTFVFGDE